ncbi:hypothetical protein V6N13_001131 [Hibiscus sabdariffa]
MLLFLKAQPYAKKKEEGAGANADKGYILASLAKPDIKTCGVEGVRPRPRDATLGSSWAWGLVANQEMPRAGVHLKGKRCLVGFEIGGL